MCFNWKEHKALTEFNLVITPYVPNVIDVQNPEATFGRQTSPDLQDRPTLVIFSGRCTPNHDHYYGKILRCAWAGRTAERWHSLTGPHLLSWWTACEQQQRTACADGGACT